MLNMKKALIAGAVLTALATTAFAAEAPDNKPTMKERVNSILHENDQHPGFHKRGMHNKFQRNRMTPEQREKFQKMTPEERKAFMKKRHEEWVKNMTPEQKARYEQHKKMMKERKAAHDKLVKEKMGKLTKAQRAEVEQFIKDDMTHRKAMADRWRNMTPEQKDALKAARPAPFGHRHPGPKGHGPKGHGPHMNQHGPRGDRAPHLNR